MGYRSDVALAFNAETEKAFQEALKNVDGEIKDFITGNAAFHKDMDGNTVRLWQAEKWYEDFPEVEFVENFIADLGENSYRFIRVGEELADVEERGDLYGVFELYPETRIHFTPPDFSSVSPEPVGVGDVALALNAEAEIAFQEALKMRESRL
jgi:hypothetical protein